MTADQESTVTLTLARPAAAITTPASEPVRPTARTVEHHLLTPDQARHLDAFLALLGTADGLIEDEPKFTDPAIRQYLSSTIAVEVGITLTWGYEIAQCNSCSLVMDGALAETDGGRMRCADCRADWQATLDEGPDTSDRW